MHKITRELKAHYSKCFEKHGPNSRGVDWGKAADLSLRYDKMLAVIRSPALVPPSLLDVGCGFGGLCSHASSRGQKIKYTGIDVVPEMILHARRNIPSAKFHCRDIFSFLPDKNFHYVVCNGILTQKLSTGIKETDRFAKELIKRMYKMCDVGIAFNVMTSHVNFMAPNLFYKSPVELVAYCLEDITSNLLLDHSYGLYEYTVYLYKKNV